MQEPNSGTPPFRRGAWARWLASIGDRLGWSYAISERELQRYLGRSFPISGSSPFGSWALSGPRVSIEDEECVSLELAFGMGSDPVEKPLGRLCLQGHVWYKAADGAFYVDDVKVLSFGINGWDGPLLPLRLAVEQAVRLWFRVNPVFCFDDGRCSHSLLRRWLRRVESRNGSLLLRLGPASEFPDRPTLGGRRGGS